MKILKIVFFTILILNLNSSCKKDDDRPPIEQLPPATQTGEQTFGCLIDGKAFVPDRFGGGRPSAFYQFVRGAYTLGISASKRRIDPIESVSIAALDVDDFTEGTYQLINYESGNFTAEYRLGGGLDLNTNTTDENPGKLTITRFDKTAGIISGTFAFTVPGNEGNQIQIMDGRFDLRYTN